MAAPGITSGQVEQLVTRRIETTMSGVSAVTSLRSTSAKGLSVVTSYCDPESDVYATANLPFTRSLSLLVALGLRQFSRSRCYGACAPIQQNAPVKR